MTIHVLDKILVDYTMNFIQRHVSLEGKKILDVGCGNGLLSLALQESGAHVAALEEDVKIAEIAIENGITPVITDFLKYSETNDFDIVLFSRSLHHIHDIDAALNKAHSLVKPGGLLILEEFDLIHIDLPTLVWYYDKLSTYGNESPEENPLLAWEQDHDHNPPLTSGGVMEEKVDSLFKITYQGRAAYLFRSIAHLLDGNQNGYEQLQEILQEEESLISGKQILPAGFRLIGKKQNS